MGDVIHNLPVVSDIASHFPGAQIDWVVEESFAGIPVLHPAVSQIIPVALRRWRKSLFSQKTRAEIQAFKILLQQNQYDFVIDTQGLIKSAVITRMARGERYGYAWHSARESLASLLYTHTCDVTKALHAVERNRQLAAKSFGYIPAKPVDYGIFAPKTDLPWMTTMPYAVLLHATSRDDKLWPEADWVALGIHLIRQGIVCVLPWGSPREAERSHRLAQQIPQAIAAPSLSLGEVSTLLAKARVVIGVDTGIAHLAAAIHVPVIGLYCASDPTLTGIYTSGPGINVGSAGAPPTLHTVIAETQKVLDA